MKFKPCYLVFVDGMKSDYSFLNSFIRTGHTNVVFLSNFRDELHLIIGTCMCAGALFTTKISGGEF